MGHVFISYSKQDNEFARYLRALLQDAGFPVWMDEQRLLPGTHWWKDIERNIETCAALVVIMSPNAQDSDWVEREILLAEGLKKPIFPVLYAGMPWSRLANIQFEDMRTGLHAHLSPRLVGVLQRLIAPQPAGIVLKVEDANILTIEADVVALKHAQTFLGADAQVANTLQTVGVDKDSLRVGPGAYQLVATEGILAAPYALFVGTPPLLEFDYQVVRELAAHTLAILAEAAPNTRHLAMTIHGARTSIGLDQDEVLRSQLAGYFDAFQQGTYPAALEQITIVEFNARTLIQLRSTVDREFAAVSYATPLRDSWGYLLEVAEAEADSVDVQQVDARPHAYVVMSSNDETEDIFYFGIQQPTHALGLLCEQVQTTAFTDEDVLRQIIQRIKTASVVIAELSEPDPAVYLPLGYAWGCGRPTILIAQEDCEVNLPEHQCLRYGSIKQLEGLLLDTLNQLRVEGTL